METSKQNEESEIQIESKNFNNEIVEAETTPKQLFLGEKKCSHIKHTFQLLLRHANG